MSNIFEETGLTMLTSDLHVAKFNKDCNSFS